MLLCKIDDGKITAFIFHALTWNRPALVIYFTPLNGLYFSPNKSSRLTFMPDIAIWLMRKLTLMVGLLSGVSAPFCSVSYKTGTYFVVMSKTETSARGLTEPFMLGKDF